MRHLKGNVRTDVFIYYKDIRVSRMSWAAFVGQIWLSSPRATLKLRPIKTDLAEVLMIKGLLGINILSCARIKLAPV